MNKRKSDLPPLLVAIALIGLYLTSLYSYLLFHSLAEIFSIAIAFSIFAILWNSRRFIDNTYLLFIGVAYLFIGGLDLIHTLAYKGMGIFTGYDANLPTQLWIGARYLESLSLLIAAIFMDRKLKVNVIFSSYTVALSLILLSIFYWQIFPDCFIEGTGLTAFKKISEYTISLILIASIVILMRRRREFEGYVFRLIVASIILTIGAELAFTFYVSVYGLSNLIGHYLKIISFYCLYKAFIETGINKPYKLVFSRLTLSNELLQKARGDLEKKVKNRNEELQKVIELLKQDEKRMLESQERLKRAQSIAGVGFLDWNLKTSEIYWSDEIYNLFGIEKNEGMQTIETTVALIHPDDLGFVQKKLDEAVQGTREYDMEHRILRPDGRVVWVHSTAQLSRVPGGGPESLLGTVLDITERKKLEKELMNSHKDLRKFAGRLITAQEKELSRLARELHDNLTQQLAVAAIEAGSIEQDFKDLPGPVLHKIAGIQDQLIKISKEVHNMSRDLHPSILEDLGLVRAVQSECSNFASRSGIAIIFTPKNIPDNVSKEIALSVYRIIQEGLSNIVKHADTKNAYVFLEGTDHTLLLTVRDTGIGFNQKEVRQQAALGLGSIRERVRLIHGESSITSSPGTGTTIEVKILLKRE
jgi:PAS domain S-box-containing protein